MIARRSTGRRQICNWEIYYIDYGRNTVVGGGLSGTEFLVRTDPRRTLLKAVARRAIAQMKHRTAVIIIIVHFMRRTGLIVQSDEDADERGRMRHRIITGFLLFLN